MQTDALGNPGSDRIVDAERRRMLLGLGALIASGATGGTLAQTALAAPFDSARFANLSRALTGFVAQDPAAANALLRALQAAVGADTLRRIATLATAVGPSRLNDELRNAGLSRAAETVVTALTTGTIDTPAGPRVLTYEYALVWQALPWTKPNAACGGETNYWSDPPARERT